MNRKLRVCMITGLLLSVTLPLLQAQDWPQFRGITRTGISSETGLLQSWPATGPELLWTVDDCGEGFSSITVANSRIYTAGVINGQNMILCYDLDGKQLWSTPNGPGWTKSYPGGRGTPTVYQNRVYHLSALGRLCCLDAENGTEVWAVDLRQRFKAKVPTWAMAESVLAVDNKIICTPGVRDATLAAFDAASGSLIWQTHGIDGSTSYCSPLPVKHAGRNQIITMVAKAVLGVDFATGELLWQHPHQTAHDVHATTPVYADGNLYITSGYGTGGVQLALPDKPGAAPKVNWSNKALDNHHGGVVMIDGYIYGSTHRGAWVCLDFKTGREMYSERGIGKGSVTAAGGMLYCLSERGEVGLVKPNPQGHEIVSRFRIPPGGRAAVWAHPTVAGGRLYIRHSNLLFAYNIRK